jgi:hypothetical protein
MSEKTDPENSEENAPAGKSTDKPLKSDPERLGPDGEAMAREVGGRKGPEPTRYGDWEKKGIVSDF